MALTGTDIQGISAMVTGLAGMSQSIVSTTRSFNAAKTLMQSARDEALAVLDEGDALKKNAQQRAYASMRDIQFLNATTEANKRALDQQGHQILSHVEAHTAGSGIRQSGSPLFLEADAALQVERSKQNQELTRQIGTRKFQFVIEQQLNAAMDAQPAAERQAKALLNLRAGQAGNIRTSALQNLNRSVFGAAQIASNKGTQELFNGLFPKSPAQPKVNRTYLSDATVPLSSEVQF